MCNSKSVSFSIRVLLLTESQTLQVQSAVPAKKMSLPSLIIPGPCWSRLSSCTARHPDYCSLNCKPLQVQGSLSAERATSSPPLTFSAGCPAEPAGPGRCRRHRRAASAAGARRARASRPRPRRRRPLAPPAFLLPARWPPAEGQYPAHCQVCNRNSVRPSFLTFRPLQ